jgi:hypothetical protein
MSDNLSIAGLIDDLGERQPHLLEGMAGASPSLILALEDIAEAATGLAFPFSEDYLEFLRLMGGRPPLDFAYDALMDVTTVQAAQRRLAPAPEGSPPALLIAAHGRRVERMFLELKVGDDGKLLTGRVLADRSGSRDVLADGFLPFLYRRAFEQVAGAHLTVAGIFESDRPDACLPAVTAASENLGFVVERWSDSIATCAVAPGADAVLFIEQVAGEPITFKVEARSRRMVIAIGERLRGPARAHFKRFVERPGGLEHRIGAVMAGNPRARSPVGSSADP